MSRHGAFRTQRHHFSLWVDQQRIRIASITALVITALLPANGLDLIACPFRLVTGIGCPFCGLTRSLCTLWTGEIVLSLSLHFLGLPLMLHLTYAAITNRANLPFVKANRNIRYVRLLLIGGIIVVWLTKVVAPVLT